VILATWTTNAKIALKRVKSEISTARLRIRTKFINRHNGWILRLIDWHFWYLWIKFANVQCKHAIKLKYNTVVVRCWIDYAIMSKLLSIDDSTQHYGARVFNNVQAVRHVHCVAHSERTGWSEKTDPLISICDNFCKCTPILTICSPLQQEIHNA